MDFLKATLMEQAEKYAGQTADNDEDKQVLQNSAQAVHQSGVATPQESDIHAANAAHEKVYQQGNTSDATDEELGKAAGVQAFKAYEKSEDDDDESDRSGSGGQGKLVQMAMAEAMKMFSGGGGQDKSAVVQSAIAMAMQLFAGKSGAGGGGVAQLMSMLGGAKKGGDDGEQGGSGGMMGMLGQAASNPQVSSMLKKFM
ncbi:hypothetical protein EC957_009461 [Mortierella hygrophila]|uniref:DUF7721 domain-containing protein n=1 Tax=Mortierella hygrophila TaxID=979708 RepID=A0A9P6FBN2_9FUNG|nr:hypothetical protein EC957_009461 [Mortierella hygrophila]